MRSTLLARGSVVLAAGFEHGPEQHVDPDEERFDHPVVIFPTAGAFRLHGRNGWIDITPALVALGHPGESYRCAHVHEFPDDATVYLTFNAPALRSLLDGHPDAGLLDDALPNVSSVPRAARIEALWRAIADTTRDGSPGSALRLDCLAIELLLELRRTAGAAEPRRPRQHAAVHEARRFIDDRLHERIDLTTLAAAVHISPFHFHRLFREATGLTPHAYVVERRLQRAAELLREDDFTVTEVSRLVGYATPSHFSAAFRRRFGVPPSKIT